MGKKRRFRFQPRSYWTYFWIISGVGIAAVSLIFIFGQRNHLSESLDNKPRIRTQAIEPRIVSLTPQATEILLSMGCGDHLAAVSNVDDAPAVSSLPRVGDYQTTDWETIAAPHPQWIITHFGVNRIPAGFTECATSLGIRQLNLLTETIDSNDQLTTIEEAISELGRACRDMQKATTATFEFRSTLNTLAARAAPAPKVSALIVIGAEGTMVAGSDTFLSQALVYAGGANVAAKMPGRYPKIDREQLLALNPNVIIQLLPAASPQVAEQAKDFWAKLPQLSAVRNGRVVQFTQWYVLLAGCHTADLAAAFFKALHPSVDATEPAATQAFHDSTREQTPPL